jgi:hypothetical protein
MAWKMSAADPRAELHELLEREHGVTGAVLGRLDVDAEAVEIVRLLEELALIDERRSRLLDWFRAEASSMRRREEERSVRQFVLSALDDLGTPQTAGFLEDYLYATEFVEAKSRGMGALRRDEYRAWDRLRDRPRRAYIVPCLDENGRPVSRWLSRSDWQLHRRLIVEGAAELWAVGRVIALVKAYHGSQTEGAAIFGPLVDRYAEEALGDTVSAAVTHDDEWLENVRERATEKWSRLEPQVLAAQERAAERLGELPEERSFWGLLQPTSSRSLDAHE